MQLAVSHDFVDEEAELVFYSHQVTFKNSETKSLCVMPIFQIVLIICCIKNELWQLFYNYVKLCSYTTQQRRKEEKKNYDSIPVKQRIE